MNKIIISGYLGHDPKFTVTKDGKSLAKFDVAVKRKSNREKIDWMQCTAFGDGLVQNFLKPFVRKSSLVFVTGELQFNEYEKSDGTKGMSTSILVSDIELLKSGERAEAESETPNETTENKKEEMQPISDQDLPF